MAQTIITQLVDDITGNEIESGAGETVTFSVSGVSYEIDLASSNVSKFNEALKPYIEHGRKVGSGGPGRRRSASPVPKSTSDYDAKAVRVWAAENDIEVPARGRIPGTVLQQYRAAN